jgi:hypothetical protein
VTADRFQTYFYNSYARQDSVLPSGERVYSLRETFNNGRCFFDHIIEDGGRIFNQGDYITISFWAKTSGKQTGVSLGFYWYDSWSLYTQSTPRYNIIIEGSTWKYYSITCQLQTNANNRSHLAIEFDNLSGLGNGGGVWSSLGANEWWEFANIQIEKGKVATPFEYRSYGEELALCQRYLYRLDSTGSVYTSFGLGLAFSSTYTELPIIFPTPMRTSPIFSSSSASTFVSIGPSDITPTTISANHLTSNTARIQFGFSSGGVGGDARQIVSANTNSAFMLFSAEL